MTDRPRWDTDLTPEAAKGLPPADRHLRIVTSLARKVEWIEGIAGGMKAGDPAPDVPRNKAALRRKYDPALALWLWRDRVVDSDNGPAGDLVKRWRIALDLINTRRRGGARAYREEIALRDRRIEDLELQVSLLLDERRSLRERLARRSR